jgi:hypothetical protein
MDRSVGAPGGCCASASCTKYKERHTLLSAMFGSGGASDGSASEMWGDDEREDVRDGDGDNDGLGVEVESESENWGDDWDPRVDSGVTAEREWYCEGGEVLTPEDMSEDRGGEAVWRGCAHPGCTPGEECCDSYQGEVVCEEMADGSESEMWDNGAPAQSEQADEQAEQAGGERKRAQDKTRQDTPQQLRAQWWSRRQRDAPLLKPTSASCPDKYTPPNKSPSRGVK